MQDRDDEARAMSGDRSARRRGSTYLEVQVAFAVLGVALAGLAPVVVSQLRMTERVEDLLPSDVELYFAPMNDPWARKLGIDAELLAIDPGPSAGASGAAPVNTVEVVLADVGGLDDLASVEVLVEEIPEPEGGSGGSGGPGP
jgi:hypothetical protein